MLTNSLFFKAPFARGYTFQGIVAEESSRDECVDILIWDFPRERFTDPPPTHPPLEKCAKIIKVLRRYSCSTLARGKRKHIMRFEIRYFFLEIGRGQTDRGYKKPDTNTDIRTPQFVSDNRNRIVKIAIR